VTTFIQEFHQLPRQWQGFATELTGNGDERVRFETAGVAERFDLFPSVNVCGNPRFDIRADPTLRDPCHFAIAA
jgi:hypothetical protein